MNLTKITDRLFESLDSLGEISHIDPDTTTPETLIRAADLAEQLAKTVRDLNGLIKTDLINAAGQGTHTAGALTAVIKPRPAKKITDWPLLLPAAIHQIDTARTVDPDTGAYTETTIDAICRQLPDLIPMTPSVAPKTTGLAALGIDRDAYTDTEWAAPSVTITRNTDTADIESEQAA